jgi:hypothetical protein
MATVFLMNMFVQAIFTCLIYSECLLLTSTTYMDSTNSPSTKPLYRGTQIVWYIVGIIEVALAFRFALKMFGANADAGFTAFIYASTFVFAQPFLNVFRVTEVSGSVFEWTTLLAMFAYGLVAYGLVALLRMSKTVSTPEAAVKLRNQESN